MSSNELAALTAQINNFGQMPIQILLQPHAPRRPRPPPAAPCAPVSMRPSAPLLRLQLEAVPLSLLPLDDALLVFDAQRRVLCHRIERGKLNTSGTTVVGGEARPSAFAPHL